MMPLHASFKIRKIAARIGTFASVENRTGNCHMFKILCLTSNFKLPNSTGMPKEWGKVKKKKKKDLWKLTPPFFNDFSQWNTSSWHHLSLQSWWEIPSCHVLPPFFFKTAICFDRCTWLISSTQKIRFRPWWGTSTWRRTIVETCGDRVLCLQNTSHDLHMWSRQFLSKTWGKQEMRKVQRLNGYNNFRGMSGKNVIWHILLHF